MRILMWEHFSPGGPIRVGGHHLAERFLRGGASVAWCVGPVSPVNFLKTNPETKARMRLWRSGGERVRNGLFAYAPMTLVPYRPYPVFDSRTFARLTLRATVPPFRSMLARNGFDRVDLLWMTPGSPMPALLDGIPHGTSVYRMSDDTPAFPDTPGTYAGIEGEVVRRVDLVVATATGLAERARALGARHVLHLPNACDPAPFLTGRGAEPEDLGGVGRPRAIYAGAIDHWFDVELVAETARLAPEWSFVLLGPVRTDLGPLDRHPNVRVLGPRPYESLPRYLLAADAGLVPFRCTALTDAIHPIKLYEYCAAGLNVVATPMRETASLGAPVRIAGSPEGFAAALREGLQTSPAVLEERRAFARANTWDHRFSKLVTELAARGLPWPQPERPAETRAAGGIG